MFQALRRVFRRTDSEDTDDIDVKTLETIIDKYAEIQKKEITLVTTAQDSFKQPGIPKDRNAANFVSAYQGIVWAYRAVCAISDAASSIPLKIYNRADQGTERKEVRNGLAFDLFQRPNPHLSFFEWKQWMHSNPLIDGNGYSYIDSEKRQMWALRPANTFIVASRADFIDYYHFVLEDWSVSQKIDPINIVHSKTFNPSADGYFYGMSPLSSSWDSVTYLDQEAVFNRTFWKEGGRLYGAFTTDREYTPAQVKQLKNHLKKNYRGTKKMFSDYILHSGIKYQQLGVSAKDQQIIERLKLSIQEVLAAYGVPPAMVGLLEYANYSNMEVQERLFYQNAVLPALKRLEESLNKNPLLSENGKLVFQHDLTEVSVLQENMLEKAKLGRELIESGQRTQNEVRRLLWNEKPVDGGDILKPLIQTTNPLLQLSAFPERTKSLEIPATTVTDAKVITVSPIYSSDEKEMFAKAFDEDLKENDTSVQGVVETHFARQKDLVLSNLRVVIRSTSDTTLGKDKVNELFVGFHKEAEEFSKELKVPVSVLLQKFGDREHRKLSNRLKSVRALRRKADSDKDKLGTLLQPQFNFSDPLIQKYLLERPIAVAGIVDQRTLDDLRLAIAEDIKNQASYAQISETVEKYFDSISKFRANRIARTETASAANFAIEKTYTQNKDVVWGKQWISARDENVRDSHKEVSIEPKYGDQPIARTGEFFVLGSGASGPRPTAIGEASEDINCRCTIAPITRFDALDRGFITDEEFDEVFV